MEDLQGGSLALEHRYHIDERVDDVAFLARYSGVQKPFERPVWILVYEAMEADAPEGMFDRIKFSAVESADLDVCGVARTVDFGEISDELPFVVQERVDAPSLAEILDERGTLPPDELTDLIEEICEVVDAVHRRGTVHGGLTPWWIRVPDEGAIRIGHFRLGLRLEEMRSFEDEMLPYEALFPLAPEQFGDESPEPDVRDDVYAVAAIAYRALAGMHPYFQDPNDTSDGLLRIRTGEPRDLEEFGVDQEIAAVVAEGLARDRERRFASVSAFSNAFVRTARGESAPLRSEPEPEPPAAATDVSDADETPGWSGTLLAFAILLLVASNFFWLFYGASVASGHEAEAAPPDLVPVTVLPTGVQLHSDPEGANVFRVDGDEVIEIGRTPVVIDPKSADRDRMAIEVRKRGFFDSRLHLVQHDDGYDLEVRLVPADHAE